MKKNIENIKYYSHKILHSNKKYIFNIFICLFIITFLNLNISFCMTNEFDLVDLAQTESTEISNSTDVQSLNTQLVEKEKQINELNSKLSVSDYILLQQNKDIEILLKENNELKSELEQYKTLNKNLTSALSEVKAEIDILKNINTTLQSTIPREYSSNSGEFLSEQDRLLLSEEKEAIEHLNKKRRQI